MPKKPGSVLDEAFPPRINLLLFLLAFHLSAVSDSSPHKQPSTRGGRITAGADTCLNTRGRGTSYYTSLASRGANTSSVADHPPPGCLSESRYGRTVTHCCLVEFRMQGRSGNQLLQHNAGRGYAELHSCAFDHVSFVEGVYRFPRSEPGGDLGEQREGGLGRECYWPPVGGGSTTGGGVRVGASNPLRWDTLFPWTGLGGVREDFLAVAPSGIPGRAAVKNVAVQWYFEFADIQYSLLSFTYDLDGGSLVGSGVRGLGREVIYSPATLDRIQRWGRHREACARTGISALARASEKGEGAVDAGITTSLEALHPWLPSNVFREAEVFLRGGLGWPHPRFLLGPNPERTIVLHVRLGDMFGKAVLNGYSRSLKGNPGALGEDGSFAWVVDEASPPSSSPSGDGGASLPANFSTLPPSHVLELLEGDAGRVGWTVAPYSFYASVLRSTRGGWDRCVVVVAESQAGNPLVRALVEEFGAEVFSGTLAQDMALLALARQLVVSVSTFAFSAAAMGRARVVHAPHMGGFLVKNMDTRCLLPPPLLDPRWVFYDVFGAAVDRIARGFTAQREGGSTSGSSSMDRGTAVRVMQGAGVWTEGHVEWRQQPQAPMPVKGPGCPPRGGSGALAQDGTLRPLSYDQLAAFYREQDCSKYYFSDSRVKDSPVCSDEFFFAPLAKGSKYSGDCGPGVEGRCHSSNGSWIPTERP
jgi:hypothetical protein